jgi:nucleoid DNA-binding protein
MKKNKKIKKIGKKEMKKIKGGVAAAKVPKFKPGKTLKETV